MTGNYPNKIVINTDGNVFGYRVSVDMKQSTLEVLRNVEKTYIHICNHSCAMNWSFSVFISLAKSLCNRGILGEKTEHA